MHPPLRIAIAEDDPDTRAFLERAVPALGHAVSSVAADGRELVAQCAAAAPDLILTDVRMPGLSGLDAVAAVNRVAPVPAVLLTGYTDPPLVARALELGVLSYLVKPVTEAALGPAIALARRQFEEVRGLRREAAELRQALEDRKLVERAKGAVARRAGLPEAEAYARLREMASRGNRKLAEVARVVIAAEEVFSDLERADG